MIVYRFDAPRGRRYVTHDFAAPNGVVEFLAGLNLQMGEKVIVSAEEMSREEYDAIPACHGADAAREVPA